MNELKFRLFLLTLTVVLFAVGFTPLVTQNVFADTGTSNCTNDCDKITLGVDSKGNRIVSNGISYNGLSADVERYHTPYPLITVNIGDTNKADFKIYSSLGPKNIRHFTLAFGLDTGQIISQSKVMIEFDFYSVGTSSTKKIHVTDPENVLDQVIVNTNVVSCSDDSELECLNITIYHRFRAPLDFNIVATDIWDNKRNSWQNYYNHGIEVVGESLNPPKEYNEINRGKIYHLTEISKTVAIDADGNFWTLANEQWKMDHIPNEHDGKIPMGGYSREHIYFDQYKNGQLLLAQHILEELCKKCIDEPFGEINNVKLTEPFEYRDRTIDPKIREILDIEASKAEQKLEFLFESLYVAKVFD